MKNTVAKIIMIIGYVEIFSGLLAGIIFGTSSTTDEFGNSVSSFHFQAAFIWWVSGIITGMLFIGFAEVIKLLSDINDKLHKTQDSKSIEQAISSHNTENKTENLIINSGSLRLRKEYTKEIPQPTKKDIEKYLNRNNVAYQELYSTPFENYVIIKSDNDYQIVKVTGYKPTILTEDDWTEEMKSWYASEYIAN